MLERFYLGRPETCNDLCWRQPKPDLTCLDAAYPVKKMGPNLLLYSPMEMALYFTDEIGGKAKECMPKPAPFFGGMPKIKCANNCKKNEGTQTNDGLFICVTTGCNLKCSYCYASGGDSDHTIDFRLIKAAIDFKVRENNSITLAFHGGGEPTLALPLIKKSMAYARDNAKKVTASIQTNGVFQPACREWLLENMDFIVVSCDGPPEIQDKQRPFRGSGKSSVFVEENLQYLAENHPKVSVRATATEFSASHQNELVEYFHRLGVRTIDVDPQAPGVGRGKFASAPWEKEPDGDLFTSAFLKAKELAEWYGLQYLSAQFPLYAQPTGYFCGALNDNFILNIDGSITACLEACSQEKWTEPFRIGECDANTGKVSLDQSKVDVLKTRTAQTMEICRSCMFGYNCCGYCPARLAREEGGMFKRSEKYCTSIKNSLNSYLSLTAEKTFLNRFDYFLLKKEGEERRLFYNLGLNQLEVSAGRDNARSCDDGAPLLRNINVEETGPEPLKDVLKRAPHILFVSPAKSGSKTSDAWESELNLCLKNRIKVKFTKPVNFCLMKRARQVNAKKIICEGCSELFLVNADGSMRFCATIGDCAGDSLKSLTPETAKRYLLDAMRSGRITPKNMGHCVCCIQKVRGICGGIYVGKGNAACGGVFGDSPCF